MSTVQGDLSSGLPVEKERVVNAPPDVALWSENLLFAFYDPVNDLGFWLHLGTYPRDWTLWEDRVLIFLPGEQGVLGWWGYHQTPEELRPAGANLSFRCVEPFRKWHLSYVGVLSHQTDAEMRAGWMRDERRQRVALEIDVECRTPVWDAHTSATARTGHGGMQSQEWASEHYEQLYVATGTVSLPTGTVDFHGTGWRDHSRGPRDMAMVNNWGGHIIAGALYPESGRAWGLSRYYDKRGMITLEGGFVVDDGVFEHAEVLDAPRLRHLQLSDEAMPIHLRWSGGELQLEVRSVRSMWLTMFRSLLPGVDLAGEGTIYALNFAECRWDDETAHVYMERSDMLNQPAPPLTRAG
jgi:hypothetical protein